MATRAPHPTPDDGWQCAYQIAEDGGYATIKRDGELVQRTVHCLRALNRATTQRGVRAVAKKYPDIFMALKVSNEDSLRPLEIKARVLAGQPDRAVARAVGLTVSTVAAYVELFFGVRDRLEAGVWIRRVAIGLPLTGAPSVETLALLHCWRRGLTTVEPWLDYLEHQGELRDLKTEIGRQRASLALLVAAHQLPNNDDTQRSLFKKSPFILLKSPEITKSASIARAFSQNAVQMTGEIVWREPKEGMVFGASEASETRVSRVDHRDWAFARAG